MNGNVHALVHVRHKHCYHILVLERAGQMYYARFRIVDVVVVGIVLLVALAFLSAIFNVILLLLLYQTCLYQETYQRLNRGQRWSVMFLLRSTCSTLSSMPNYWQLWSTRPFMINFGQIRSTTIAYDQHA